MNKTALVDAGHILDAYHAQQVGTVVCIRSFDCYDEDTGEVFEFTEGISCLAADHDVAREFPENFAESTRAVDGLPGPDENPRPDPPPAPDLTGLLVCVRGFEFEDPDTGYPRWVRYGHDFVEPGSWLDRYYGENFVRVEEVVPSDGIPGLPLRDDDE